MRIIIALAAAGLGTVAPTADAATLLMLERPGCMYCARWDLEIAPVYAKTDEGLRAPLRRVDLSEGWPEDLGGIARDAMTPTFVLVEGGREVARLRGYPGDSFFWQLLGKMLDKLPVTAE
ncbi:thioredoxin domain-containing protein [Acuticoccus sediminis]|uniref:transcriptional regulator n=1 Tax=Acuticoccus sediminis TaxID=2184697 RepID=UPI001CFE702A|nr:transcriptional regulator [Acuticoccus sediminis]